MPEISTLAQARSEPARPNADPVPGKRLPAALPGARLAARTAPRGAREITAVARTGSVSEIARCKRTLVVTYRRNGTPVPTPVWAAERDGILYVRSERTAGKVKRLRRDPRMLIAPCTVRGRPLGAPLEAAARVLDTDEEARDALWPRPRAVRARDGLAARGHVLLGDHAGAVGRDSRSAD